MENLLDKHGWKFECNLDGGPQHGIVKVTDYGVCLKFFDCDEVYEVGNGSAEDIKQHYPEITNFRLLEPGEPESKCKRCGGSGWVMDGYDQNRNKKDRPCPECTIKKEPTVSKEEAERHDVITRRLSPDQVARHIEEINVKDPPKSESDKQTIRRETATQLLAGMGIDKTFDGTQHPGLIEHYVNTALLATDLLLKKLGE